MIQTTSNDSDAGIANGQAAGTILIDGHQFARRLMALSLENFPEHLAFELTGILADLRNGTSSMKRIFCAVPKGARNCCTAWWTALMTACSSLRRIPVSSS